VVKIIKFANMLKDNFSEYKLEVGTDEAGRGCLAVPVVAAAVILPKNFKHKLLNDSKQLTHKQREIANLVLLNIIVKHLGYYQRS
jgi:ribonuclease HII